MATGQDEPKAFAGYVVRLDLQLGSRGSWIVGQLRLNFLGKEGLATEAVNRLVAAVRMIQAGGDSGIPASGHWLTAAAKASGANSSARSKSPSSRMSVATIRPESERYTPSTTATASAATPDCKIIFVNLSICGPANRHSHADGKIDSYGVGGKTMGSANGADKESNKAVWAGRGISSLVVLFMIFDGVTKLMKIGPVQQAAAELGFSVPQIAAIGILLLACTLIYVIPQTSVLGAILLTGYLGGATAIQFRVHNPLFETLFPVIFGVLVWAGLYLCNSRLRAAVLLWRKPAP
jgi:hypothetical protein